MTGSNRYSHVAIALHWVIALTIIGLILSGWQAGNMRDALFAGDTSIQLSEITSLYSWHKTFGLVVLGLSLVRLGWRLTHKAPPLPEGMAAWEKLAATGTHWAFYALMIGMPIGGWVHASATPFPNYILNNPDLVLPDLVPDNETIEAVTGSAHSAGGWAILVLLALHVGAALKHHIINKDDVLTRMVIFLKPRG